MLYRDLPWSTHDQIGHPPRHRPLPPLIDAPFILRLGTFPLLPVILNLSLRDVAIR